MARRVLYGEQKRFALLVDQGIGVVGPIPGILSSRLPRNRKEFSDHIGVLQEAEAQKVFSPQNVENLETLEKGEAFESVVFYSRMWIADWKEKSWEKRLPTSGLESTNRWIPSVSLHCPSKKRKLLWRSFHW